jgi:hypothetical protein
MALVGGGVPAAFLVTQETSAVLELTPTPIALRRLRALSTMDGLMKREVRLEPEPLSTHFTIMQLVCRSMHLCCVTGKTSLGDVGLPASLGSADEGCAAMHSLRMLT